MQYSHIPPVNPPKNLYLNPDKLHKYEKLMIKYAIIFAVISLLAGVLGFTGVAAGAASIAKIAFGLFLILTVIFIVLAALGVGAAKKVLK